MAPILGIMASQISGHLWAPSGAYDSIATVTVGAGGTSYAEFTSIPSTYQHLQIRAIVRSSSGGYAGVTFNSDTGNNYASHELYGNGSSASAGAYTTRADIPLMPSATSSAASTFTALIIDVLDYANTSKYKTLRSLEGWDANGSGYVELQSGLWQSTSAISTLRITCAYGQSWQQYSSFALYGIKSA